MACSTVRELEVMWVLVMEVWKEAKAGIWRRPWQLLTSETMDQ